MEEQVHVSVLIFATFARQLGLALTELLYALVDNLEGLIPAEPSQNVPNRLFWVNPEKLAEVRI